MAIETRYWQIAGDAFHVWSLQDHALVTTDDATYLDWLNHGGRATPIPTAAELFDVISTSYPGDLMDSVGSLDTLGISPLQSFQWRRAAGAMITYTGNPLLDGHYAVDDLWYSGLTVGALLRSILNYNSTDLRSCPAPMPLNLATTTYFDADFVPHTMSVMQLIAIVLGIQDYMAKLQIQLAIGLQGGTPDWPPREITVTG